MRSAHTTGRPCCLVLMLAGIGGTSSLQGQIEEALDIGAQRELFVDRYLIDRMSGDARQILHQPVPREVALDHDQPWEGNTCGYHTVFKDGDLYRMYYRGSHHDVTGSGRSHPQLACYAESRDGIHWTKPELGLFEFEGTKKNNIVWMGDGTHNFTPFKDTNPDCPPAEQYKALGGGTGGLQAFASPDGIHWSLMQQEPVITKGAFDSQNLAFWDAVRGQYVEFHRRGRDGVRDIMTCTSNDFLTWTEPVWLEYPGAPKEHLYTNQVTAYHRAPHIFMGFPKRFMPDRRLPGNRMSGLSDGVYMTSRDGVIFHRWTEAFIRPGPQRLRWVNRNNMTAWGIVETTSAMAGLPNELSVYSTEGYYQGESCQIRRYSLRLDGFVSIQAPLSGGELLSKPLVFSSPEKPANGPARPMKGAVFVEQTNPIKGTASLVFEEPSVLSLPGTKQLGKQVTFAVHTRGMPAGHRRLFSAYNGGPIKPGDGELIFDIGTKGRLRDGSAIRFNYDGEYITVAGADIPDWDQWEQHKDTVRHFAATWDDGVVRIYLDGAEVASGGKPGRGAIELKLGDLRFGEDYPPTSLTNEPFLGMADDILVLRRLLGPEQIATLARDGAETVVDPEKDEGVLYTMEPDGSGGLGNRLSRTGAGSIELQDIIEWGEVQLLVNYSTSAAGSLRCEIQDAAGNPVPGYAMEDCDPMYGDHIEQPISWQGRTELQPLVGKPVRLRFELKDADLYAIRFGQPEAH